ncbi:site-specific DNA-methyltransferase [uncultured Ruminococcus sp.]|uniref:site-specific DNA-methyltransferase n=1 Tax=uncultured Ruminococcus sp. TaxID=165186 RepID=UPI00292E83C7|nr:site-specific DNA-methyltransferase [uncultured Ruminococcus sp.]
MDKMKMQSKDRTQENYEKLAALFPNAVTETITGYDENGKAIIERAIDKDVLQQEISAVVVEGRDERYQFTWPDKKKSILAANAPIRKTLRPCREESVDFDNTENLYIEGDNLDVLKLLQETYLGKVKMIYIDPPYNTGSDFVYNDNFKESVDEYIENSGQIDDDGNHLFQNTESNGRFHTDWLNMLYPRLKIARDLLSDDGVIFISINDYEAENLKKICDEVFGSKSFVAQLVWEKKKKGAFLSKHYINMKEYVLVFCKSNNCFEGLVGEVNTDQETYPCIKTTNARGIRTIKKGTPSKYKEKDYTISAGTRISSGNMELIYLDDLEVVDGVLVRDVRVDSNWIYSQKALDNYSAEGLLYITQDNYVRRIVNEKRVKMLKDLLQRIGADGESLSEFTYDYNLNNGGWGTNEDANDELHKLLGQQYLFDFSKPSRLIGKLAQSIVGNDYYCLDFFSGSATTAHAVMYLNASDGGNRKFIMVQLPELCDEKKEAYKAGYKNICEIGKERIRRAGKKITEESGVLSVESGVEKTNSSTFQSPNSKLDIGFRVLKLDSTNMKDVYYNPHDVQMSILDDLESNIKEDRTPEDLLFQVMLDLGVLLSSKIEESTIAGKKVFNVADNFLIACFDENVSDETITAVAKLQPAYFVMRDSSMKNDSVATNFDQIFATYSPDTVRKVI